MTSLFTEVVTTCISRRIAALKLVDGDEFVLIQTSEHLPAPNFCPLSEIIREVRPSLSALTLPVLVILLPKPVCRTLIDAGNSTSWSMGSGGFAYTTFLCA